METCPKCKAVVDVLYRDGREDYDGECFDCVKCKYCDRLAVRNGQCMRCWTEGEADHGIDEAKDRRWEKEHE